MLEELIARYPYALPLGWTAITAAIIGQAFLKLVMEPSFTTTVTDVARNECYAHACNGLSLLAAGLVFPFVTTSPLLLIPAFLVCLLMTVGHVSKGFQIVRGGAGQAAAEETNEAGPAVTPIDGAMALLFSCASPAGLLAWAFLQLN